MDFKEFTLQTRRTWNYQDPKTDFQHAILGLIDEVGELSNAVKKKIGYGQIMNITNIKEECGDLSFFIAQIIDQLKLTPPIQAAFEKDIALIIKSAKITGFPMFDHIRHLSIYVGQLLIAAETENDALATKEIIRIAGLLLSILAVIALEAGTTFPKILDANIAKLHKRFPNKFNKDLAKEENRDKSAEADVIKKHK